MSLRQVLQRGAATIRIGSIYKFYSTSSASTVARIYVDGAEGPSDEYRTIQLKALNAENCILVDEQDRSIGSSSKWDCHRVNRETGDVQLHRAFSVFLFNTNGDMLIQRRSKHKITFPDCYTNACCSHPLFDIDGEKEEANSMGVRLAAQRRLNFELGIPMNQARPEDFHYLTRILYKSLGDGTWGEHEIDYILFLQREVDLTPNPSEVSELLYVKKDQLFSQLASLKGPLTPWFQLILNYRLRMWWDNLKQLKQFEDLKNIHRLT